MLSGGRQVEFRLLGPLEATGDAGPVRLAGGKQNALLALLLLHADRVVPMGRLVDDLWGEHVPGSAQKMVQIFVSQLRKQLPDGLVRTRAPGYEVALEGHTLDLREFERLSTRGRDALRHGRAEEAAASLREAQALWRGPALAEFQEPFAEVEGARLAEQQLACVEDRIEADLALGRHHELVAELETLVRRHPLRERLRGQLMLALYRAGRHAEALESYQSFRRLLDDELGIDPPTSLKELERRILQQDPALATPARRDERSREATVDPTGIATGLVAPAEPVVGRERELAHLERLFREAQSGQRRLVFVSGEPGIGKTAIVDAFVVRLSAPDEPLIARGQCVEHRGAGEPYLPVLEAIGGLCRQDDGERIVQLLARQAPTWLAQMPWHIDEAELASIQSRVAGATHERMLREMLETVEAITAEAPLVLILEDLHWSDGSTVELLEAIARRRVAARLLVVGTYRRGEALAAQHPVNRIAQALRSRALCTELAVGPLAEEAVAEYVATRTSGAVPGLPQLLHQRTDGHPLFAKMLLESWLEHGLLGGDAGADLHRLTADVPDTVRELIEQMLLELASDDQELLEAASVAGRAFSAAAVAAAIEGDDGEIELRCAALARAKRFLDRAGEERWPDGTVASRFAFSHDLHREVLYGRLPAGRRAGLHGRIGLRLDAAYGARASEIAAELAEHLVEGGDAGRAVVALRLAGEQALHRLAPREAFEHLQRGLQMLDGLDDGPDRWTQEFALQSMLGAVLIATRGWSSTDAEAAFLQARQLAEKLQSDDELGRILFLLGTLYDVRGEYARSERFLQESLSLSGRTLTGGVLTDSHELLACTLFHQGSFDDALQHAERGLEAYDGNYINLATAAYGDNPGAACHSWAALSLWFLGYPDRARERVEAAVALTNDPARRHGQATALAQAAVVSQCRGDLADTRTYAEAALEAATRDGYRYRMAMATILRGWALAASGTEDGIAELRRGLELSAATGARMDEGYYLALLADASLRVGRLSDATDAVETALDSTPQGRSFFYEAELYRLHGDVLLGGDAADDLAAEQSFRRALAIAHDLGALSLQLRSALSLGRLLAHQGRDAEARALVDEVYRRFTEGFETLDLVEARTLIEELDSSRSAGA
jgi:DNA-binding SARP family transcriptional activator